MYLKPPVPHYPSAQERLRQSRTGVERLERTGNKLTEEADELEQERDRALTEAEAFKGTTTGLKRTTGMSTPRGLDVGPPGLVRPSSYWPLKRPHNLAASLLGVALLDRCIKGILQPLVNVPPRHT